MDRRQLLETGNGPATRMTEPRRTLRSVVDLMTMQSISSVQLLAMQDDEYQVIRRAATRARLERRPRYVCSQCGHAVYAPRDGRTGKPYFRHHPGAPETCSWWTGIPSGVDDVSRRQFQGAQESPLHAAVKSVVGELLRLDGRTAPDSVVIDEYLITQEGRRRPDVRAVYDEVALVVEIQLATTQIPIIVQREDFYEGQSIRLLWLTWNFEPPAPGERLLSSFEDISFSHNGNLFSVDDETIRLSRREGIVVFRVFWKRQDDWHSKLVNLSELSWMPSGRAFAVAPERPWNEDFLERWRAATGEHGTEWPEREALLGELAERLQLPAIDSQALGDADTDDLINCLLSLLEGRPIGSRQKNLVELLNTFLSVQRRHRFARVVKRFAELCDRQDSLDAKSVRKKLIEASKADQDDPASLTGRIALELFPKVFAGRATRAARMLEA